MGQRVWCPRSRRKKNGRNFFRSGCAGIRVHDPRRLCKNLHATKLEIRGLAGAGSSIFQKAREEKDWLLCRFVYIWELFCRLAARGYLPPKPWLGECDNAIAVLVRGTIRQPSQASKLQ